MDRSKLKKILGALLIVTLVVVIGYYVYLMMKCKKLPMADGLVCRPNLLRGALKVSAADGISNATLVGADGTKASGSGNTADANGNPLTFMTATKGCKTDWCSKSGQACYAVASTITSPNDGTTTLCADPAFVPASVGIASNRDANNVRVVWLTPGTAASMVANSA